MAVKVTIIKLIHSSFQLSFTNLLPIQLAIAVREVKNLWQNGK